MSDTIYNLGDGIPVGDGVSKDHINKWNTVINILKTDYIMSEKTITLVEAEKYRYDMEGLLQSLGISREFIYPHIRVNGYKSSRDYKGDKTVISIIEPQRLYLYKEMFNK